MFLLVALALHLAEVGIIGLTIIVLQTAFNGITEEARLGHAFEAAMPSTGLLVVFFGVVAVIGDQHLFVPLVDWVLHLDVDIQAAAFFLATGALSAISDNVFVATILRRLPPACADRPNVRGVRNVAVENWQRQEPEHGRLGQPAAIVSRRSRAPRPPAN